MIVLALALGACGGNPDLPSLGGATSSGTSALEQAARSYFDCMTAAGLPMELMPDSDGAMVMVQISFEHEYWLRDPDTGIMQINSPADDDASRQAQDDFMNGTGPALIIDGIDHTDVYVACRDQSGYDWEEALSNMRPDPEMVAKQVESNNNWAACAREHGWPDIQDSVMPAVNSQEYPQVVLPATITEDQLRQLLVACPNFDPGRMDQMAEWARSHPESRDYPPGWLPDPAIGFDDSTLPASVDESPGPEEQAAIDRFMRLQDILYEAQQAYFKTHDRDGNPLEPTATGSPG